MSRFWRKFLCQDKGFGRETKPRILLGAFGKHPGWDDHIDDIGLNTESLLLAKQLLYVEGLGGQIDSGEWDKLGDAERLPGFDHLFVWRRANAFLIGKIWSSRDGKNRTKYPMIVCAQCVGISLALTLRDVLPVIEQVEQLCKATNSADEVRVILSRAQADVDKLLDGVNVEQREISQSSSIVARLIKAMQEEDVLRILYHIRTQMRGYLRGASSTKQLADLRACHLRSSVAGMSAEDKLLAWCQFLYSEIERDAPILLLLPLGADWLDAIVGCPSKEEFYCLRATPKAMAITSDVPYGISDQFRQQAKADVRAICSESDDAEAIATETERSPAKWLRKLGWKV